jgi:hypothetical protein
MRGADGRAQWVLHPAVPATGSLVDEPLTGHAEWEAGERHAWPSPPRRRSAWTPTGIPQAVIGCWRGGAVTGLQARTASRLLHERRTVNPPIGPSLQPPLLFLKSGLRAARGLSLGDGMARHGPAVLVSAGRMRCDGLPAQPARDHLPPLDGLTGEEGTRSRPVPRS